MEANLTGETTGSAPERRFPYTNWGPAAAILGVVLAIGAGILMAVPVAIVGQDHGSVERLDPPDYAGGARFDDEDSTALAVGSDGTVYADHEGRVLGFDAEGAEAPWSPIGEANGSAGMAIGGTGAAETLYLADPAEGEIRVFGIGGGEPRETGRLATPRLDLGAIAVAPPGPADDVDLYAIDRAGEQVVVFDAAGNAVDALAPGDGFDDFDFGGEPNESAIAVAAAGPNAGNVYVASDQGPDGAVWAFAPDGTLRWELTLDDVAPCGLAVDSSGRLWVGDTDGEVTEYGTEGRGVAPPAPTGRTASADKDACELAFAPDDALYVAREADAGLTTVANVFVQLFTALGFLLVPMALASYRGAAGPRQILDRLGFHSFNPWTALKWTGGIIVAYLVFTALYTALVGAPEQEDIAEGFGPVPIQVLLIVIAAPISEEVCFRGMLFGGLREKLPLWAAALIAGAIFGALHALTGISAVPPLIVFGALLCVLYEKTGSLWPAILLHVLNNSVALSSQ